LCIDAILEQNIYGNVISEYIELGGAPMDAVTMLSESYIGVPSMCNVTAASVNTISGLDSQAIMRACIRQHFEKQFNPKQFDHYFLTTERDWDQHIAFIINDPDWRSTIYDLLATHTTCAFLNFIVLVRGKQHGWVVYFC
jgi:hypothetical protein